jgi:ligand-binding SRPBCC domain-containing protein
VTAYTLQRELRLERERDEVFRFFSDARNLQQITPPWLGFSILTPGPIAMRAGTLIDYRIRLRGLPLRWQSEITEWDPPRAFTDEQRRGPYRLWRHRHRFEPDGGETVVTDHVTYAAPGGRWVHTWWVRPELERIFAYRQARMVALFPPQQTGRRS